MRPSPRLGVALLAALALVGAACGGGDDGGRGGGGGGGGGGDGAAGDCPVDALEGADTPVQIRFWHVWSAAPEDELRRQVRAFNAAQDEVEVKLVYQAGYREQFAKYRAGLGSGDLPDVGMFEETVVQAMLDSRSTVTMQDCVEAGGFDVDDLLPRAVEYYSTEGVLRAMPYNISNPVLFYDKGLFERAGLDPDRPPRTFEEVREYSQQIVDRGVADHGIALRSQDWYNEFFYAKAGQSYVNNGGGRDARATAATLDNDTGLAIWTWWKEMVDSGLALNTGSMEGNTDHLFAIGNRRAAMTIEASSALGAIIAVLESGQFPGVQIGVAPLPGLEPGGGVPVGDGALWITNRTSPEKQAAAWKFVEYLLAPEQLKALHLATGYVPLRVSLAEDRELRRFWSERPEFRVAYDQLLAEGDEAANGSVIGNYQGVRDAVREGLESMLTADASPEDALRAAQEQADAAIQEYNDRVGA